MNFVKDPSFNISNQFRPSKQASMKRRMSIKYGYLPKQTVYLKKPDCLPYLTYFLPDLLFWKNFVKDPSFNLSNQFRPSEQASMKRRMSIKRGTLTAADTSYFHINNTTWNGINVSNLQGYPIYVLTFMYNMWSK